MHHDLSRRQFLGKTTGTAAALTIASLFGSVPAGAEDKPAGWKAGVAKASQ